MFLSSAVLLVLTKTSITVESGKWVQSSKFKDKYPMLIFSYKK